MLIFANLRLYHAWENRDSGHMHDSNYYVYLLLVLSMTVNRVINVRKYPGSTKHTIVNSCQKNWDNQKVVLGHAILDQQLRSNMQIIQCPLIAASVLSGIPRSERFDEMVRDFFQDLL